MKLTGNTILITGGASGIGKGLALRFADEGNTVIICGRRRAALDALASERPAIITRPCDLSSAAEREALVAWLRTEHPAVNVLVNNAGIQLWMAPADPDFFSRAEEEIAVNIEAPLHLTHLFLTLPHITTVVNVTSGLSFVPLAKVPVYSATKAFFHSWTLSLRYLLASRGIEVVELIPPALNTDLGGKGLHDHAPPVTAFIDAVFTQLNDGKNEATFGFSEAMAKAGPAEQRTAFDRMNPPV